MKNTEVKLIPLTSDDREQFILDNQWVFKYGAWLAIEVLHPETVIRKTCTQYFEKRNIHFCINKCGFKIDQFWCEYFHPEHETPDKDNRTPDEGPDEMFRFVKVLRCEKSMEILISCF